MAKKPVCLVCQREMEVGFMTDHAGGYVTLPRWCPGVPAQASKLAGGEVASSQFAAGLRVTAYRCPECEALRFYAPAVPRG